MAKEKINHIKLGVFVTAGLAFLILLLYVIGKNQNLFGRSFGLRVRFENVHGLRAGNNVRYAGIDIGTVKSVSVINDSTVEVRLAIDVEMEEVIHRNAVVRISTDGLMGNKLVNIEPSPEPSPPVQEDDVLYGTPAPDTDDMLRVLRSTNNDVAVIAHELRQTISNINQSKAVWSLLQDESLPSNLRATLQNARNASERLGRMVQDLQEVAAGIRSGEGTVGKLLRDTMLHAQLNTSLQLLQAVALKADSLSLRLNGLVAEVHNDLKTGRGTLPALLKDEALALQLNTTLREIEEAGASFQQTMEGVQHSFLFRKYFKKKQGFKPH